jgi:hypothetical protein
MPRQFGKVDVSASWAVCAACPCRHPSHAPCPPVEVWLVLHFCPACNEATLLYCRTHRDRHMPALALVPPLPELDIQQRRLGEDGGDCDI